MFDNHIQMPRRFKILKWIVPLVVVALLALIAFWLSIAHADYRAAWISERASPPLSKYSVQFLLVARGTIDLASARNQLIRLSAENLRDFGKIGFGEMRWHFTQIELLPYVYLFVTPDEVYKRLFSAGYFGGDSKDGMPAVGVANAAQSLWSIGPGSLSISQSALLVALNWSPSKFNPRKHPEAAMQGRSAIIQKLVAQGLIDADEAALAETRPLEQ